MDVRWAHLVIGNNETDKVLNKDVITIFRKLALLRAALHGRLILRIQRLRKRPFVLLGSIHVPDLMFRVQVFPKVTRASFWAIAMCVVYTKAIVPVICQNQGTVKNEMAYRQAWHRLIASPSSFLNF